MIVHLWSRLVRHHHSTVTGSLTGPPHRHPPQQTTLPLIQMREDRLNFAASISRVSRMAPIPHQRAHHGEATADFSASPNLVNGWQNM